MFITTKVGRSNPNAGIRYIFSFREKITKIGDGRKSIKNLWCSVCLAGIKNKLGPLLIEQRHRTVMYVSYIVVLIPGERVTLTRRCHG